MAILKGISGGLKISTNLVADMTNWQVEGAPQFEDTTSLGDTAKEQTPTFFEWSGSAEGRYDIADTNGQLAIHTAWLAMTTVTPRFYVDNTHYYSGSAYVSMTIGDAVDGYVSVSYTFTGTGALSYN